MFTALTKSCSLGEGPALKVPVGMSDWATLAGQMSRASFSCLGEIGGFGPHGSEPWSRKTNEFKIDTCRFLARRSALLG